MGLCNPQAVEVQCDGLSWRDSCWMLVLLTNIQGLSLGKEYQQKKHGQGQKNSYKFENFSWQIEEDRLNLEW